MSSPKSMILVVAPPGANTSSLTEPLSVAGFAVELQPLLSPTTGPTPSIVSVEGAGRRGSPVLALVVVTVPSAPQVAAAFTHRLRADRTSSLLPVLWVLTDDTRSATADGLDAGADVCLTQPVDGPLLVAQVNALLRTQSTLTRFVSRGADSQDLTERLQKLYQATKADAALARHAVTAFRPRESVRMGPFVASWHHRPAIHGSGGLFDLWAGTDDIRFLLIEVGGLSAAVGAAVATSVAQLLMRELSASPRAALNVAHRRLTELPLPDAAVVSAMVGVVHTATGRVTVACGGLPSPVLVPAIGSAGVWQGSGPFLNSPGAEYHDLTGELSPGEKLVVMAGGAVADRRPDVRVAAESQRTLSGQSFAVAVGAELLSSADPDDGFTLMVIERQA